MIRTDKIAILLATYNGEKYLEEQLLSLLAQTNNNWVTYIHDDGSMDNTVQIIDDYCKKYPDKFVKIEGLPTGGAKNNFYFLMRQIYAPGYFFCDQDDVWLPNKIEKSLSLIDLDSDIPEMVYSDLKLVDANKRVIAESMWDFLGFNNEHLTMNRLIVRNTVTGCTIAMNNKLWELMLKYENINNIPMHDKWAALIALKFGTVKYTKEQLVLYRQHEGNVIGAVNNKSLKSITKKIFQCKKIKQSYEFTRIQAQEFSNVFKLKENDPIRIYGELLYKNKLLRIWCYFKYSFFSESLTQIVGMILFG